MKRLAWIVIFGLFAVVPAYTYTGPPLLPGQIAPVYDQTLPAPLPNGIHVHVTVQNRSINGIKARFTFSADVPIIATSVFANAITMEMHRTKVLGGNVQ